ncbi:EAL domain-containing protein [Mesorhizobium sp. VK4C]|uniref:putative bifunctional diguanylate cyclase/phosphodiesterase n=1 Tax=Mesorhizobium captivum TaxID=3072319 RepID=UPI002A24BE32|nr:EAL domain-containing protein [Mesorhizobium sp. VK4C]MDX8498920.1 EAL domain-containing protein [Mesorhizobium sp. VK4C]
MIAAFRNLSLQKVGAHSMVELDPTGLGTVDATLQSLAAQTEFDDVRLILRRWQSACGASALPPYEEIALGSVGRFSDEIAVVRRLGDEPPFLLRSGQRFRAIVGFAESVRSLEELPYAFNLAIGSAIDKACSAGEPRLTVCHWVVDGKVSTIEIVALPLSCRWPGEYFLLFLRPRASQVDLASLLINSTQEGIIGLSPIDHGHGAPSDFYILSINEAAAGFLGSTIDSLQFTRLSDALTKVGISEIPQELLCAGSGGRISSFELAYWLEQQRIALKVGVDIAGGVLAVTLTDIRDLKARETLFRSLFDDNPVPMFVRSQSTGSFLNVNEAALRLYGYSRGDFLKRSLAEIRVDGATNSERDCRELVLRHRTADGRELDVIEYTSETLVDHQVAILSTIVDITERKRAEAHITYLAHHDPLTGVANRTVFTRELERAADSLEQNGRRFGVVLIDLDNFKTVNDTLGHAAGDALLIEVTARLRELVRKTDVVARLGGDEFAILVPAVECRSDVEELGQRIIRDLTAIRNVDGAEIGIGASIGAALVPDDATDIDSLLKCADLALYRAKQSDKGTFRWFEAGMDMRQRERRALEIELRGAEIDREFELHYQPIIQTQTGKLRGFEALLRWQNPRRGMVSPADFIPIAEETGILDELGRWVLAMACREAAAWPGELVLSVNVSPVQFRKGNLVGAVGLALADSGLEPHQLEIEITESVLLADSSTNLAILKQLRSLGVRIALDDFGTGYSSLSYLRQFPFNRLKIDRSFVREIGRCPESLAIVRAVIGLGASLGIDTTAEGVETVAQLEALRAEKCGELQGFLFSPPVSSESVASIIGTYFQETSLVA